MCEHLGCEEAEATLGASFTDDLGADSLDFVEMVMAVEDEFGIEIGDEEAGGLRTLGEAADHVLGKPAGKPAAPAAPRYEYPHARGAGSGLHPVTEFHIGGRTLSLYTVEGRPPHSYSLYWNGETFPVQSDMTPWEVFMALHGLLDKEG